MDCERRFTTYERAEVPEVIVRKKSGRQEPYDKAKIIAGLQKACNSRDVSTYEIEEMTKTVERQVRDLNSTIVDSATVGDFVMRALKDKDKVAYARFASVYQGFEDLVTVKDG